MVPVQRLIAIQFALALAHTSVADPANAITKFNVENKIFNNRDCSRTDTCSLKRFWIEKNDYIINTAPDDQNYGTRMIACYETDSIEHVEEFGIVQFLRGCQFGSKVQDGRTLKTADIAIHHFGGVVSYLFPDWTIDSWDNDPIALGSDPRSENRHFFYWNRIPGREAAKASDMYGIAKPAQPILCVRDLPGAAFIQDSEAKNISLQFLTCLYKAADVPRSVEPRNIDFAKPIRCFDWSSSFIYNHPAARFESPAEIDAFCKQ